jgi:hypothetical protein
VEEEARRVDAKERDSMRRVAAVLIGIALMSGPALAQESKPSSPGFLDIIRESLFGDVYAEPSKWQPLTLGGFFSESWNRPWVSPPPGEGGAPRQGWLNAYDGVFYRLGILTGGFADNFHDNGNQYTAGLTFYAPFNARFEFRLDIPFIASNRVEPGGDYQTHFGDLVIAPRVLLTESQNFTQSFNVAFRIPTGSEDNANGFGAATPTWAFWWNPWSKMVLRGGAGFAVPFSEPETHAKAFIGNLAAGYYFTPHDFTPLGDLVGYLSFNLNQPVARQGGQETVATLTPGFRTHLGRNWYLLGGVEVPVTRDSRVFDFQLLFGLMKVY